MRTLPLQNFDDMLRMTHLGGLRARVFQLWRLISSVGGSGRVPV